MGNPTQAEEFFATYWPDAVAIGDPKQQIYRGFQITWGSVFQFFKPSVWRAYLKAKSHGIGKPQGNTMRNPGAFLVHQGRICFTQKFGHFGVQVDTAEIRRVVGALAS